jgi:hypothetical protein
MFYFALLQIFMKQQLFDIQSCQPGKLYFPYYDYDYLLVNKN